MFRRLIWMIEERVTGELVSLGAHSSRVQFTLDGIHYDENVMNDEYIFLDDLGIEYEMLEDE